MSTTCHICNTPINKKVVNPHTQKPSPYWMCPTCGLYQQDPLPPKVYEGVHEKDETGHSARMGDHEKAINQSLAEQIFRDFMGNKPGKCLDIGSKYPYLSKCFNDLGCTSYGMDAIDEVEEYRNELNIPMVWGDFEKLSAEEILAQTTGGEKFDLITLVHCFEHLYDMQGSLKKMKELLTENGRVFLRLPSSDVPGWERDMNEFHFVIHPFYHCLSSLLELLVRGQDLFTIDWTSPMDGAGQRDLILKPLKKKPEIWCGMIVKNEERDLPKCLMTIQNVVDGLVIMDTGSTDATERVTKSVWGKPLVYETYTGASKQDESGDWKLWDFGKARNQFVERIEAMENVDYLIWFDADDTLLTPNNLKKAFYLSNWSVFGMMVESGMKWVHHRAWKTKLGIHFGGRIHEYPVIANHSTFILEDVIIHHDAAAGVGEDSNQRNLRILEAEFNENPNDGRTAFYLANTHKDAGRFKEAIPYYAARLKEVGYWDEWMFTYLYKARCERACGLISEAIVTLLEAASKAPEWAEFWMELGYIEYDGGNKEKCIGYSLVAANCKSTTTQLWREDNKYQDQPRRIMSFAYNALGKNEEALYWALEAKKHIGVEDISWDERIKYLQSLVKEADVVSTKKIALNRPGAIGDIIMTLNLLPGLMKKYPGYEIDYFCDSRIGESLSELFKQAGINRWYDFNSLPMLEHDYEQVFNMIGYPIPPKGNYPEEPMTDHLLNYFAAEVGLDKTDVLPQLELKKPTPLVEGPYITIHAQAGWSMYKNWTKEKWEELIIKTRKSSIIPVKFIQIGAASDYKIEGCDHSFMGHPLMDSINLIANAELHMGVDSFSNHLTHIKWNGKRTPGVILWGSTQYTAAGYEENINISLGLPCQPCFREDPRISRQPRGLCINPEGQTSYDNPQHACMSGITVDMVLARIGATV